MNHALTFSEMIEQAVQPALRAARRARAIAILADHYFDGLNEQTAATVLALHKLPVSTLGDVSLRDLIAEARRSLGLPGARP